MTKVPDIDDYYPHESVKSRIRSPDAAAELTLFDGRTGPAVSGEALQARLVDRVTAFGEAQGFQIEHLVHFTPQAGPCVPGQLSGKQEAQMNAGKPELWMKGCGGIGAFDGAGGEIRHAGGRRRQRQQIPCVGLARSARHGRSGEIDGRSGSGTPARLAGSVPQAGQFDGSELRKIPVIVEPEKRVPP